MRHYTTALMFLLALSIASFAECGGNATTLVPAVVGTGGGTVEVSVRAMPGEGNVYLTAWPHTGVSTQLSAKDAVECAFLRSGMEPGGCDVLVKIGDIGGYGGYVDGPSAGGAMCLLAYSALNNLTPREGVMMTGSIDSDGNIGRVGGLFEKAKEAAENGAAYFLLPPATIQERLLLQGIESSSGLELLEIEHIDEAIAFIFHNGTVSDRKFRAYQEKVPDIVQFIPVQTAGFMGVAEDMIAKERMLSESLPQDGALSGEMRDYFGSGLSVQEGILSLGYYFAAANEAFNGYVELLTVSDISAGNTDIGRRKEEVGECLRSVPEVRKTDANFEWVLGAEVREARAAEKLNSTELTGEELMEEKYIAMDELNYALAWCEVAKSLKKRAGDSGTPVRESGWKEYAARMISDAAELESESNAPSTHLEAARLAFARGSYGAAVYEAVYARDMELNGAVSLPASPEGLLLNLSAENRTSLWGEVYHSQAVYLLRSGEADHATVYRLFMLGRDLDSAMAGLRAAAEPQQATGSSRPMPAEQNVIAGIMVVFIIIILLLFYAMICRDYAPAPPGELHEKSSNYKRGNRPA